MLFVYFEHNSQMSSVIHANQQSVIQTASTTVQSSVLPKSNVILVGGKLTSVIQTPHGNLQPLQVCIINSFNLC